MAGVGLGIEGCVGSFVGSECRMIALLGRVKSDEAEVDHSTKN